MQDENECLGVANTTSNTYRKKKQILKSFWNIIELYDILISNYYFYQTLKPFIISKEGYQN